MGGESIEAAAVTAAGFAGDRGYAVVDPALGKIGSAKHPRLWGALLQCRARYLEEPAVDGPLPPVEITLPDATTVRSDRADVDERLSAVFGRPVQLCTVAPEGNHYLAVWPEIEGVMPDDFRAQNAVDGDEAEGTLTDLAAAVASPPGTFFDVAALHVVTTATLARLNEVEPSSRFAVERYRPNLVVDGGDEPFAENAWSGATIRVGDDLTATGLIPTMRCIMTTLAQGDLPRDNNVLQAVTRHNRIDIPGLGTWSCVGAYATVASPGPARLGDAVMVASA
jgi:uncharacterized protein YcbX